MAGFPHSEIVGSKLIRSSPTLIAAYHVLHRLSTPRHPPDALKSLDRSHYQCLFALFQCADSRPFNKLKERSGHRPTNGTHMFAETNKHLKKDLFVQDLFVWLRSGKPV